MTLSDTAHVPHHPSPSFSATLTVRLEDHPGSFASLARAMRGVSHVFHCAGLVSDWGRAAEFHRANVDGTRRVVEAAVAAGVRRFVHMSSAAVHGYRGRRPFTETSPRCDRGIPYIASKIAAEKVVVEAVHAAGLHAVMLRPVMVFGPGSKHYVAEIARLPAAISAPSVNTVQ